MIITRVEVCDYEGDHHVYPEARLTMRDRYALVETVDTATVYSLWAIAWIREGVPGAAGYRESTEGESDAQIETTLGAILGDDRVAAGFHEHGAESAADGA